MGALIVSDYDGTIKTNDSEVLAKNLKAIKSLIQQTKLMIATGRVYKSIEAEIEQYGILFNYLSCANGNALFDQELNELYSTKVNPNIISELKDFYKYILDIESFDAYGNKTSDKPVEYLIHLIDDLKIRRQLVNMLLASNTYDYCTDGSRKCDIHIFNATSKADSIEIIRKRLRLLPNDIYTIGDGPNDIEMIKRYNGHIVGDGLNDYEEVKDVPTFDSFNKCVPHIQRILKKR